MTIHLDIFLTMSHERRNHTNISRKKYFHLIKMTLVTSLEKNIMKTKWKKNLML